MPPYSLRRPRRSPIWGRWLTGSNFSRAGHSGRSRRPPPCAAERLPTQRAGNWMSDASAPVTSPDRVRRLAPSPARIRPLQRDSSYVTCQSTRPFQRVEPRGFPGFAGGRKSGLASCLPDQLPENHGFLPFCRASSALMRPRGVLRGQAAALPAAGTSFACVRPVTSRNFA